MIEYIIFVILALFFFYYLHFLWMVFRGLQGTLRPTLQHTPFVSVIVAARNEGKSILRCLQSLARQEYPVDCFEIIVVDDHSTDDTLAQATSMAQSVETRIKVVRLSDGGNAQGKPVAIAYGVEISSGSLLLCTDADCEVPSRWIRSMAGCFEPSVVFVAGPVLELVRPSFLSRLQALEFLGIITASAGLIGYGAPIICNGANIAYRKAAYRQVSGYGLTDSSCDDETLMQRMIRRSVGQVVFNADADATILTSTPEDFREFWSQRTRWAAKRGRYEDDSVIWRLLGLFGFFVSVLVTCIAAMSLPDLWFALGGVLAVKALAEFVVLKSGATLFGQRIELGHFVIAELFHVPYIATAATVGQIRQMRWKGRTFDQ